MTSIAEFLSSEDDSSPLAYLLVERRRFRRVRLNTPLPAQLGRVEGVVVDLSIRGARMCHTAFVPTGGTLRLTFKWKAGECSTIAKVISSRLVSRVNGSSSVPLYETRLRLVEVPHTSEYFLARFLARIAGDKAPRSQRPATAAMPAMA